MCRNTPGALWQVPSENITEIETKAMQRTALVRIMSTLVLSDVNSMQCMYEYFVSESQKE